MSNISWVKLKLLLRTLCRTQASIRVIARRLHIPDSAPCKTLPADWIWFKGGSQNFFSQNFWFCLKMGGGLTKTQVFCAKQILLWNCQNTWDKILGQSAKKIWARSPLKQQTLKNDTLLNSCSRDPTFCIMNVHLFGAKVLLALLLISAFHGPLAE